eukprot:scpid108448/ scgid31781/ 
MLLKAAGLPTEGIHDELDELQRKYDDVLERTSEVLAEICSAQPSRGGRSPLTQAGRERSTVTQEVRKMLKSSVIVAETDDVNKRSALYKEEKDKCKHTVPERESYQ